MTHNNTILNSNILLPMQASSIPKPHITADIATTLISSITHSDNATIKQASDQIAHYQSQPGYLACLLEIINSSMKDVHDSLKELLVRAALTQLKVYVRKAWKIPERISQEDKLYLVQSFVKTSFNISSVGEARLQVSYMRLLKDVIEITCQESIAIFPEVVQAVEQVLYSEDIIHMLPVYLNIVLGFVNNHATMLTASYSQKCVKMLGLLHPLLHQFTHRGEEKIHKLYDELEGRQFQDQQLLRQYELLKRKYQQILYLNIKLLYKGLFIKDIEEIRQIIYEWIPVALNRIQYVDPTFTHSSSEQRHQLDTGLRGTDEFNYFHGKKWAIKLVRCSMERLLIYSKRLSQPGISTIKFYQLNLSLVVQVFKNVWQYQWPSVIKCELLRAFDRIVEAQSFRLVNEYYDVIKYFQEELLPPMIDLSWEKDVMQESPVQFMLREKHLDCKGSIFDYRSCRLTAATLWLSITTMDFVHNKECKDAKMLRNGLMLIYTLLQQIDINYLHLRDIGCFLLTKLEKTIRKIQEYNEPVRYLVNRLIKQNLQISHNTHFMVLVRAFELASQYNYILSPDTMALVRQRFGGIINCLDLNREIRHEDLIILVKGSKAVQYIIETESSRSIQISSQEVKALIEKLFCLIQVTAHQEFIFAVSSIMKNSMKKLKDCYQQIAKFMQDWFALYMEKDLHSFKNDPAKSYRQNYVDIARGTITIYETILRYIEQGDNEIVRVITSELIKVLTYIFSQEEFDVLVQDDGLSFLQTYLQQTNRGNTDNTVIQLCRIMVLRIAGLPVDLYKALKQSQQQVAPNTAQWKQLQIYINCQDLKTYEFESYVGVIRAFIKHIDYGQSVRSIPQIVDSILNKQTSNTEYLIYLASRYYGCSDPAKYEETCYGKCFCMLMLIHYYEHHQRSDCTARIHHSVNHFTFMLIFQTQKEYSIKRRFAKYNSQLFCLWMHELQHDFINFFRNIDYNQLQQFVSSVLVSGGIYGLPELRYYEQHMRGVYGISTLLKVALRSPNLWQLLSVEKWVQIISYAINFGYKSTQECLDESDQSLYFGDQESEEETKQVIKQDRQRQNSSILSNNGKQQEYMEKITALQEEDESGDWQDDDEDEYSNESDNCWQYEQSEDCPLATPLQQLKNDGMYLLGALYDLYNANCRLYIRIIEEELLGDKMHAILKSNFVFTDQSRQHLKVLCEEEDWEEQN